MKSIAIIGAEGMLGSDLTTYLRSKYSLASITKKNYNSYIGSSFDIVINANGNSKRFWANENIVEDFKLSTLSVYNSLFDFKFHKYIYISSSDVYQNHEGPKYTNENSLPEINKLSPYGFHKYLSESIVKKYAKDHIILRSSMILGITLKKGPIYDIMHNKVLFVSKDSRIQMITTKEISEIIHLLIKKKSKGEIYNMGGKGVVLFNKINNYFTNKVNFSKESERQAYEINVKKLNKIYALSASEHYLRNFLKGLGNGEVTK